MEITLTYKEAETMYHSLKLSAIACTLVAVSFLSFANCTKHHSHEPTEQAPPDTVVVIDTLIITDSLHVHHDHPFICIVFDLEIEFTVIGDQSAPNEYAYFLNGIEVGRFIITETYTEPTEITFRVLFERVTFGDVITIQKISGSRVEAIGSAIVGIECS